MANLGAHLKLLREQRSLKTPEICKATGISDSVLSHLENNRIQKPNPFALKKLADYYHVNVCSLYIHAGYLDELFNQYRFNGVELLTDKEAAHIQALIDILNENKRKDGAV